MAQTAVGLDVLQSLEIQAALAAQIAFHEVIALLNDVNDLGQFCLVEVLGTGGGLDAGFLDNIRGDLRPDAVDVSQRNVDALVWGDVDSDDSWHGLVLSISPDAACAGGWMCR